MEYESEIREIAVDAVRYVNQMGDKLIPLYIHHEDKEKVNRDMSRRIRKDLSHPVAYAVLQVLMRLADFADETDEAAEQLRDAVLPKPKCDLDYTARWIWARWGEQVAKLKEDQASWHEPGWNPYGEVSVGLDHLISHIWSKHFLVEDM